MVQVKIINLNLRNKTYFNNLISTNCSKLANIMYKKKTHKTTNKKKKKHLVLEEPRLMM